MGGCASKKPRQKDHLPVRVVSSSRGGRPTIRAGPRGLTTTAVMTGAATGGGGCGGGGGGCGGGGGGGC